MTFGGTKPAEREREKRQEGIGHVLLPEGAGGGWPTAEKERKGVLKAASTHAMPCNSRAPGRAGFCSTGDRRPTAVYSTYVSVSGGAGLECLLMLYEVHKKVQD